MRLKALIPRFRLRTLMALVAVAAVVVLLTMRDRYDRIQIGADDHRQKAGMYARALLPYDTHPGYWMLYNGSPSGGGPPSESSRRVYRDDPILPRWRREYAARVKYHEERAKVWDRALWQPWFGPPSDPKPSPIPNSID